MNECPRKINHRADAKCHKGEQKRRRLMPLSSSRNSMVSAWFEEFEGQLSSISSSMWMHCEAS